MSDVLLLVGKGQAEEALEQAAQRVYESLTSLGLSVALEYQGCLMSELTAQTGSLLAQHENPRLLVTVGFTASVTLAEASFKDVAYVPILPDNPGNAAGPFDKSMQQLERLVVASDYLAVLDEPSRAFMEYRIAGASGKILVPEQLRPLKTICEPLRSGQPRKILVSGHDFRFIGDAVAHLSRLPGVEVRVHEWKLSEAEPTDEQRQDAEWADVVLAEWAGRNAVWFSQNLGEHQRLVVHLHGFEADAVWIDQLHFERVEKLVVVSDFYRQKLIAEKGWSEDKLTVIPNTLETAVFERDKRKDARFHLAMIGFTPLLKRADLAIEVLRRLLEKDDRYVLHLRGEAPWKHDWVWNRRVREVDAFAELYAQIGQDSRLRDHVVFERYDSNVEAWLSGIGWVLSLSDRETFHLAAAEGMASGAVPVFLPRDGVTEIFSDRWVFEDPQAIADFIYLTVNDDKWQSESIAAQAYATRFDVVQARILWQEVLV